jgi:hypothetical protein
MVEEQLEQDATEHEQDDTIYCEGRLDKPEFATEEDRMWAREVARMEYEIIRDKYEQMKAPLILYQTSGKINPDRLRELRNEWEKVRDAAKIYSDTF